MQREGVVCLLYIEERDTLSSAKSMSLSPLSREEREIACSAERERDIERERERERKRERERERERESYTFTKRKRKLEKEKERTRERREIEKGEKTYVLKEAQNKALQGSSICISLQRLFTP